MLRLMCVLIAFTSLCLACGVAVHAADLTKLPILTDSEKNELVTAQKFRESQQYLDAIPMYQRVAGNHPMCVELKDELIAALIEAYNRLAQEYRQLASRTPVTQTTGQKKECALTLVSSERDIQKVNGLSYHGVVTGVIKNTSSKTVWDIRATFGLLNKDSQIIDEVDAFHSSNLLPGEEWVFQAHELDDDVFNRAEGHRLQGITYLERNY